MEPIKEQVIALTQKVDALHQTIDQVNARVSEILATTQSQASAKGEGGLRPSHLVSYGSLNRFDGTPTHKDVLVDPTFINPERSGDEQSLSPEVQIQRLTAQLTAAYNRIAALEEQLMAVRAH
jgi:prefoldin subunit 5